MHEKAVKFKLVTEPEENSDPRQVEIDNYYKFKRRQERQRIKKQRQTERKNLL